MTESGIVQILTLVAAIVASILSILTRLKQGEAIGEVTDLKIHINSKMDQLLETTKVAAALQGRADLFSEQLKAAGEQAMKAQQSQPAGPGATGEVRG